MKFGLALLLNFLELMKDKVIDFIKDLNIEVSIVDNHNIPIKDISMIKYAREFDLCYVDGPAYHLIKEKKNLFLLCPLDFKEVNPNISYIKTKDPKLLFYKLSYVFNPINGYIDLDPMMNNRYPGAFIDKTVKIGKNVRILPGVTIYPNTEIGNNVVIESGSVIGCTGLLWVWDNDDKIMLSTNGKVIIGDDCHISSNVSIVRGANMAFIYMTFRRCCHQHHEKTCSKVSPALGGISLICRLMLNLGDNEQICGVLCLG